jgi:cystathionine beta-lyase/cystathionine gamma-synthase
MTEEERLRIGITHALVRVAVGVEHWEDLWRDLSGALNTLLPSTIAKL